MSLSNNNPNNPNSNSPNNNIHHPSPSPPPSSRQRRTQNDDITTRAAAATNATMSSSEENDDDAGWLNGISSSIARIKEKFPSQTKQALDGIANVIQRSATAIAAEFAQMEIDAEMEARRWMNDHGYGSGRDDDGDGGDDERGGGGGVVTSAAFLPWYIPVKKNKEERVEQQQQRADRLTSSAPSYEEDEELKRRILALSLDDGTFSGPFGNRARESDDLKRDEGDKSSLLTTQERGSCSSNRFNLDVHIKTIRCLLKIDPNLDKALTRLSGDKLNEDIFWRNYFYHCVRLKKELEKEKLCADDKKQQQQQDVVNDEYQEVYDDDQGSEDIEIIESPLNESTLSSSSQKACLTPRTLSTDDFVLVGGSVDEDLEDLAAHISSGR